MEKKVRLVLDINEANQLQLLLQTYCMRLSKTREQSEAAKVLRRTELKLNTALDKFRQG